MQSDKYLLPEKDGLPTRESQDYAQVKWKALEFYFTVVNTAMRQKWSERYYIDLQAGSGKTILAIKFFWVHL